MQNILIIVQLIVSVALVGVVLLQRSEGGALGMGGGSGMGGLFSPRGAADTLTRTTAILAAVFFLSSLALTLFALRGHPQSRSILDQQAAPGQSRPIIPINRIAPGTGKAAPQAPAVPAPH